MIPEEALKNEIKEAKWVEFGEMQHMNFSKMTSAVCKVLELAREEKEGLLEKLGETQKKAAEAPFDMLSQFGLSEERYRLLGSEQTMYSGSLLKHAARPKL